MTLVPHIAVEELEELALAEEARAAGSAPASADSAARAAEVAAHLAACAGCAQELAWVRAERALFSRRAAEAPQALPDLWSKVARRIAEPAAGVAVVLRLRPRVSRRGLVGLMGALSVAAVVALSITTTPHTSAILAAAGAPDASVAEPQAATAQADDDAPDPKVKQALDSAEGAYRTAFTALEADYSRRQGKLKPKVAQRWGRSLAAIGEARTTLDTALAVAGNDVEARVRVLDGYAAVLHSMHQVIEQSQEANP